MVTVATVDNLWHLAIRTADRHAHTLVLHQEKQSFLCHAKAFPEEAQHLAGLLDTVALGQYLRESISHGYSWTLIACMVYVIAPPRDASSHLLTMNFIQWLFPQDTSCWHLLPSVH